MGEAKTRLSKLAGTRYPRDDSHVWGDFFTMRLDRGLVVRSMRLYPGGASSLHQHHPEELVLVTEGSVVFDVGRSAEDLDVLRLDEGDVIHVPSDAVHRVRAVDSAHMPARILEFKLGEPLDGRYEIIRLEEAVAGQDPSDVEDVESPIP